MAETKSELLKTLKCESSKPSTSNEESIDISFIENCLS